MFQPTLGSRTVWLSTVSCSPFQPAMARDCPPSVSLKAATNLATSSMFQPTLGSRTVWWRTLSSLSTMNTELAGKPLIIWPSEYPLWRTPKALETSASLSDNRGTSNSLRSGLESSQSKMELVVSIETPTTLQGRVSLAESAALRMEVETGSLGPVWKKMMK